MTPIIHALSEIKQIIPIEVLNEAFKTNHLINNCSVPVNLDALIKDKVINGRVISNLQLQSQKVEQIPFNRMEIISRVDNRSIFRINPSSINNRTIVAPLSVNYGTEFMSRPQAWSENPIAVGFNKLIDGHLPVEDVSNAELYNLNNNTIMVENISHFQMLHLEAIVSHDPEYTTLPRGYWDKFAQLCLSSTEAYIYRVLRIPLAQGKLVGGMEIGEFKTVVDEFRDSEKIYKERLNEFRLIENIGNKRNKIQQLKLEGIKFY